MTKWPEHWSSFTSRTCSRCNSFSAGRAVGRRYTVRRHRLASVARDGARVNGKIIEEGPLSGLTCGDTGGAEGTRTP